MRLLRTTIKKIGELSKNMLETTAITMSMATRQLLSLAVPLSLERSSNFLIRSQERI